MTAEEASECTKQTDGSQQARQQHHVQRLHVVVELVADHLHQTVDWGECRAVGHKTGHLDSAESLPSHTDMQERFMTE